MTEYTIQPQGKGLYSVHKWDDGDAPITTYTVTAYDGKLSCSCIGYVYRHKCKHTTYIREYRRKERNSEPIESLMKVFYKGDDK